MASGNTLLIFTVLGNEAPSSGYATFDTRNNHPCLDFDPAAAEGAYWTGVIPRHYSGLGITVRIYWGASSATSGDVMWLGGFERLDDEGQDLDSSSFGTTISVVATAPGTSGMVQYTDMAFTNAEIDSLVVGELFRFNLSRLGSDAADTMAGDAEVYGVELRET